MVHLIWCDEHEFSQTTFDLPTLLAGIAQLPDHTQPKYIWLTLPVWGIGSTQPWKVFLSMATLKQDDLWFWANNTFDTSEWVGTLPLYFDQSEWVGTPPRYFDQSLPYWILFLYNSMAFKTYWVVLGHTLVVCLTALLCQLVLAYIW